MTVTAWLKRIDPGTHRRIKGLRLVTAYGIAWMMGDLQGLSWQIPGQASLGVVAAGMALWASVSEGRSRPTTGRLGTGGTEAPPCITGAFLVAYLKPSGILGAGLGSQFYIGQLLAYGAGLEEKDLTLIAVAGLIAAVAAVVPRLLTGPAEHPSLPASSPEIGAVFHAQALRMGLQAAAAALVIVALNGWFGLEKSAWAITACTYVIVGTASSTMDRVLRRVLGTPIGVPLGLACLPIASQLPMLIWTMAGLAMVVYAMALPERYDLRGIRLRPHHHSGGAWRNLGHNARLPWLGDPDWGWTRPSDRYAHLASSNVTLQVDDIAEVFAQLMGEAFED